MADIVPELLEKIMAYFDKGIEESKVIRSLKELLKNGKLTHADSLKYAKEVGEILAEAFDKHISSSVLPDGKMFYNISKRIIEATLNKDHNLIADFSADVQASLNAAAGVGIKSLKAPVNQEKIAGFIERLSKESTYDDVKWLLRDPIINFSETVVDDTVKTNAEFHAKSGLRPTIKRVVVGDCCDWCKDLAGEYDYEEVKETGNPVFMRHRKCDCLVTYDPGDGRRQNVYSKKWE